jgi:hypothetical protein
MFAFALQPTPVKFHRHVGNTRNIDRGRSGESMEVALTGGDVILAIPSGYTVDNVDPDKICVVLRGPGEQDDRWRVIWCKCTSYMWFSVDNPFILADNTNNIQLLPGHWNLISNLPLEPFPIGFCQPKLKFSTMDTFAAASHSHFPSPLPPPSSYIMPLEPESNLTPEQSLVKR